MSGLPSESQLPDRLVSLCEKTINRFAMLEPGDRVLVGVSGGPDSVALIHVLMILSKRYEFRPAVAHVNHGVRASASDADAEFVESLAKAHHMPYYLEKIDVPGERKKTGKNLEEACREARYDFFNRIAVLHDFHKIAVGHQKDDNAELLLMNLLRGSGPSGMAGIPPVNRKVIRPMICAGREEILSFLDARQIDYIHDHTNDQTVYRRNHIRHHLIPALRYYNPRIEESLNRFGDIFRAENEWIEDLIAPMLDKCIAEKGHNRLVLRIGALTDYPEAPFRRIIRRAICEVKGDLRRMDLSHVDAISNLINSTRSSASIDLPDRIRVIKTADHIMIVKEKKNLRSSQMSGRKLDLVVYEYAISEKQAVSANVRIDAIGATVSLSKRSRGAIGEIPVQKCSRNNAAMDWDQLEFPLVIRNVRPGDRIKPLGMKGAQKVSDFFINNKIPSTERSRIPLVISGNRVIWIAGFRIDERVKVTETTETILTAQIVPQRPNA